MPIYARKDKNQEVVIEKQSGLLNLGKVFGVMLLGILITTVGALLWGWLFSTFDMDSERSSLYAGIIIVGSIVSILAMIISSSVIHWKAFATKGGKFALVAPYVIYALSLSFVFGLIGLILPIEIIAITFGVTLFIYGLLALFGVIFKNSNLNPLIFVISALGTGVLILFLLNFFIMPLLQIGDYEVLFWVLSFGIFALVMFTTIYDVWQINKIVSAMPPSMNVTLYCAFRLYTDFVNLFIRILYYVIILFARRKN